MSAIRRDWTAARLKVEDEGCCRVCRHNDRPLEAAHVVGREHDRVVGKNRRVVDPDSIVPLCGPFGDTDRCHTLYDRHALDLLPHLTLSEQVRAVADAGGIEAARRRITGERPELERPSDPPRPFAF